MEPHHLKALWRASKFVWGETDCIMATCNYIAQATGVDPARPWRGSYNDEAGAKAICDAYGGVLGLFEYGMGLVGFKASDRGLLRPVVCHIAGHDVAGVDLGDTVAFMAPRGMVDCRAKVLGAWKI